MGVDRAGWRATRIAEVAVTVACALALVAAGFFLWMVVLSAVYNRRVAIPEGLMLLVVAVVLRGLWWLRAFLRDVIKGQVFTARNARRLANIGWLLVGIAVLRPMAFFLLGGMVSFIHPAIIGPMLLAMFADGLLIAGLLLLAISAAWRYGSELQSERDLTV